MKTLSKNWITENVIDAEYKRYILLAYLSEVGNNFDEKRLYPYLSEIIERYRELLVLKENAKNIYSAFPEKLKDVDLENIRLNYEKLVTNDKLMSEVEEILDFSIPQFQRYVSTGKEIYDYIESRLRVEPVGVMPLYIFEGYIFLLQNKKETSVYEYSITIFEEAGQRYRGINTAYIDTYTRSLVNTPENIKTELIRSRPKLPNPAVFAVDTDMEIPVIETYLPIAKRAVVKRLAA